MLSPPALPMNTMPFHATGAIGAVSPGSGVPRGTSYSKRPDAASRAWTRAVPAPRNRLPLSGATPRLALRYVGSCPVPARQWSVQRRGVHGVGHPVGGEVHYATDDDRASLKGHLFAPVVQAPLPEATHIRGGGLVERRGAVGSERTIVGRPITPEESLRAYGKQWYEQLGERTGTITERPGHVARRRRLGHWEIDTVAGGRGPDCLPRPGA